MFASRRDRQEEILHACEEDNVSILRNCDNKKHLIGVNDYGNNALLIAAECQTVSQCLQYLLTLDLPTTFFLRENIDGESALHKAVIGGNKENVQMLLNDERVRYIRMEKDNRGRTPLHRAISERNIDIARMFIRSGVSLATRDYSARRLNPIQLAVSTEDFDEEMVKLFEEEGCTADEILFAACQSVSDPNIVVRLISMFKGKLKKSIECFLDDAIMYGRRAVALKLLDMGADTNCMILDSRNVPFITSVFYGENEVTEKMLELGAKDFSDGAQFNSVIAAAQVGNLKLLKTLLDRGFSQVTEKRNALQGAVDYDQLDVVRELLLRGAKIAGVRLGNNSTDERVRRVFLAAGGGTKRQRLKEFVLPSGSALSLSFLCRDVVRQCFRKNAFASVAELCIPEQTGRFLLYGEKLYH